MRKSGALSFCFAMFALSLSEARLPEPSPAAQTNARVSNSPISVPAWIAAAGDSLWLVPLERDGVGIVARNIGSGSVLSLPGEAQQLLAIGAEHRTLDPMLVVATKFGLLMAVVEPAGLRNVPVPAVLQAVPIRALALADTGPLFVLLEPSQGDSCEVWALRSLDDAPFSVGVVSPAARSLGFADAGSVTVFPAFGRTMQVLHVAKGTRTNVVIPDPGGTSAADMDWSLVPVSIRGPARNPCGVAGAFFLAEQGRGRGLSLLCGSNAGGWQRVQRWPGHSFLREAMLRGSQVVLNGVTDLLFLDTETQEVRVVPLPEHARATVVDADGRWIGVALATGEQQTRVELLDLATGSQRVTFDRACALTAIEIAPPPADSGSARE